PQATIHSGGRLLDLDGEGPPARRHRGGLAEQTVAGAHLDLELQAVGLFSQGAAQGNAGPRLEMGLAVGASLDVPAAQHALGADVPLLAIDVREHLYEERATDARAVDAAHRHHPGWPVRGCGFDRIEGARPIGVAELLLDIDAVERGIGPLRTPYLLLEGIERRFEGQPGVRRHARRGPLGV